MTPQQRSEILKRRESEAIALREQRAHATGTGSFIATGSGFFRDHSSIGHRLIETPPSTGSDNGDGSKA